MNGSLNKWIWVQQIHSFLKSIFHGFIKTEINGAILYESTWKKNLYI